MTNTVEQQATDALRVLSIDAVQRANSGHPGMPMGMADIASVLWSRFLVVDPNDPTWIDRDRFVLSNGHGSMLLYSLLHFSGFPLTMDDIKAFRQFGSVTAGHPEHDPGLGIEMTTGPLGQGFATGIGMAIAEAHLRSVLGSDLVDHRIYGFVSDGDLMEGVTAEAASLAGHLGLGKITYLYDDNHITIDGTTDLAFTEDVAARFDSYGWHTVAVDGHDREAIAAAIAEANGDARPSLVLCRTHIGFGSPNKQDTSASHGSPLGVDEIALVRAAFDWDLPPFEIPAEVYDFYRDAMQRGGDARAAWTQRCDAADADRKKQIEAFFDAPDLHLGIPHHDADPDVVVIAEDVATVPRRCHECGVEAVNRGTCADVLRQGLPSGSDGAQRTRVIDLARGHHLGAVGSCVRDQVRVHADRCQPGGRSRCVDLREERTFGAGLCRKGHSDGHHYESDDDYGDLAGGAHGSSRTHRAFMSILCVSGGPLECFTLSSPSHGRARRAS
jgi:transketolase N-terminal domain/subunit